MNPILQAVRGQSLGEQAYEALAHAVLRGRLAPGTRLVEAEISTWLGISRGPLREAIRRLESEGLVVTLPRRGTYVIDPDGQDVRELYSVRAALEGYAVAGSLDRIRSTVLDQLEAGVAAIHEAAEARDWMRVAILDSEWHEPLVETAGNRRLVTIWHTVNGPLLALFAQSAGDVYDPSDVRDRHQSLLRALREGDEASAERAVRHHYMDTAESFAQRTDAARASARTGGAPGRKETATPGADTTSAQEEVS